MEYGLIPKLDQFVDNKSIEVKKIQSSNETTKIGQKDDLVQIQQAAIEKDKKVAEAKKIEESSGVSKYQVVLSNMNFGFNDESKDFYVKVTRGSAENQYPTEQMMRLKAYIMNLNSAS